ncbi:hypothetical protein APX70_04436 [Pseudomonas syringae pv. maculicola]|uniref:Uncharacterized protein n=1 Tax=Pseudomonas syringae pv. maculicola TaxID=59511 RepID=A0A3M2X9M4_PSEYM|nr:hypothetical protein APX70_04436 [Pseudomonas syringae pv. maculicola]
MDRCTEAVFCADGKRIPESGSVCLHPMRGKMVDAAAVNGLTVRGLLIHAQMTVQTYSTDRGKVRLQVNLSVK